jgi:hypothetical protein
MLMTPTAIETSAQPCRHFAAAHYVRGLIVGMLAAIGVAALLLAGEHARRREDQRRIDQHLRHDLAAIRAGQAGDILVYEPELLEMIAADPQAMANATTIVFSSADFVDARFAAVANLKLLQNVAINRSKNADQLLAQMQGMESVEKLYIEQSPVSTEGLAALATLPNLKHLRFEQPLSAEQAELLRKSLPAVNLRLLHVVAEEPSF